MKDIFQYFVISSVFARKHDLELFLPFCEVRFAMQLFKQKMLH